MIALRTTCLSPALLLAALLVVALGPAATAHASITVSAPTGNPLVVPNGTLKVVWSGACPDGLQCGNWDYERPKPGATIEIGMSKVIENPTTDPTIDSGEEVGNGSEQATRSPFTYRVPGYATAGQWYVIAWWNECEPKEPDEINIGTCPKASSRVVPFRVPAVIGTRGPSGTPPSIDHHATNGHTALYMRMTFGCNAPGATYRGALTVTKRVKQNGKLRWVTALTRSNVRAQRIDSHSRCSVDHTWTLPRSISSSTQLRYAWRVTTVGVKPAAKPVLRASQSFTVSR